MADYIESLQQLAEQFGRLQGVGRKNAMKMAFSVLEMTDEEAKRFAEAILQAKERIHLCPVCQNLTDQEICPICADLQRERATVCVVSDPKVVMSMEKVREYKGLYHVLHGVISPMNGVTPDKLKTAKSDLSILHPLPRVNEISVAIDDDPRACYFKQVLNGKYMRMALILKLLEVTV